MLGGGYDTKNNSIMGVNACPVQHYFSGEGGGGTNLKNQLSD